MSRIFFISASRGCMGLAFQGFYGRDRRRGKVIGFPQHHQALTAMCEKPPRHLTINLQGFRSRLERGRFTCRCCSPHRLAASYPGWSEARPRLVQCGAGCDSFVTLGRISVHRSRFTVRRSERFGVPLVLVLHVLEAISVAWFASTDLWRGVAPRS